MILDVETYSELDLNQAGAAVYAAHPSTEVLCVGIGGAVWLPGQPVPDVPDSLEAWNAEFDRLIYDLILVPRHGWPWRPASAWSCVMERAYAVNLPGKLETTARLLHGPEKDSKGHALMLSLCKPAAPTLASSDPKRKHTPAAIQRLADYCLADVVAEAHLETAIPPLPEILVRHRKTAQRLNGHGVAVDVPLVQAMITLRDQWRERCLGEFTAMTHCDSSQGNDFKVWLAAHGITGPDGKPLSGQGSFSADAVRALLADENLDDKPRRALQLHQELTKTSLAKLEAFALGASVDGRLRGMFQFLGAHQTGRYAGRRVQLQNIPRGSLKPEQIDEAVALALAGDLDGLASLGGGSASEALVSLLRGCLIAGPGKVLVDADYSNVEGRIGAWLAGEEWKLEAFADYDRGTGEDLYKLAYAKAFDGSASEVDKHKRSVGKVLELAGAYNGGERAVANAAAIYGIEMSLEERIAARDAWRNSNPNFVALWAALNKGAIQAVKTGRLVVVGRLAFEVVQGPIGRALNMLLPSGRRLWYHNPQVGLGRFDKPELSFHGLSQTSKQWVEQRQYGGRWLENACQAISFDLMSDAMCRVDYAGIPPVLTVHDELACEVPEQSAEVALDRLKAIMTDPPAWAEGLPLSAGGWIGKRFRKD